MDDRPYKVEVDGATTKFILPTRSLSTSGLIAGSCNCGAAVALGLLALYLMWSGLVSPRGAKGLLLLLLPGWGLIRRGIHDLSAGHGRVYVDIDNEEVRVVHRMGRQLEWDCFELAEFERLEVDEDHGRAFLLAEYADGERVVLAQEYPRAIVDALAADLLPMVQAAKLRTRDQADLSATTVVDVTTIPAAARDVLRQPSDSTIVATHAGDSHMFVIARWGFLGTPARFLVFNVAALCVAAIPALLLYVLLGLGAADRPPSWELVCWGAGMVLAIVAAFMVLGAHFFLRKGILIVARGPGGEEALTYATRGPLRSREQTWKATEVVMIYSDLRASSNSFSLLAPEDSRARIVMKTLQGRKILAEGEQREMRWLATELRRHLAAKNISR